MYLGELEGALLGRLDATALCGLLIKVAAASDAFLGLLEHLDNVGCAEAGLLVAVCCLFSLSLQICWAG